MDVLKNGKPIGSVTHGGYHSEDEELGQFLEQVFSAGVPFRDGIILENKLTETLEIVGTGDVRFMNALKDALARRGYGWR